MTNKFAPSLAVMLALVLVRNTGAQVHPGNLTARLQTLALRQVRVPKTDVICLGISTRALDTPLNPREMADPDSSFLASVVGLPGIRPSSGCELLPRMPDQAMVGRADRRPAVHIGVAAPRMLDPKNATVDVQVFVGGKYGEAVRCTLVRQADWRAVSCKRLWVL